VLRPGQQTLTVIPTIEADRNDMQRQRHRSRQTDKCCGLNNNDTNTDYINKELKKDRQRQTERPHKQTDRQRDTKRNKQTVGVV